MRLIDRYKRHGVVLALIALALQIVLTFGHMHLRGVAWHAGLPVAQRDVAQANAPTPAPIPADNDDYCAICGSIFLASSAFAPAPPQVLVPTNFQWVEHFFYAVQLAAEPPRLAFRSRAPPVG
jgi:hypothetical protein